MPQIVVHASPETGVFDYPPASNTLEVTIRRPPLLHPPPIPPACWKAAFFTLKGIVGPLESGGGQQQLLFSLHVTDHVNQPGYFAYFVQQGSVALGGDMFAVTYGFAAGGPTSGIAFQDYVIGADDAYTAKTLSLTLSLYHNRRDFELTELYATFVTGEDCGEFPPDEPPVGDDKGDDDDDSPGASGQYRAIEADSPRNWLHVGSGSAIVTYHTTPGELAFTSSGHPPKWWKQFCYNQRNLGVLACLGRDADPGSSTVYLSYDGGQTVEEAYNVTGTSVTIKYDSEREWLVVLTEGTPPDVEDPTSHGIVSRIISRDFGQTFTEEGDVTLDGDPMSARLLGMTYDPRTGGTLYLLCKILGVTKILASEDGGDSWEERFS